MVECSLLSEPTFRNFPPRFCTENSRPQMAYLWGVRGSHTYPHSEVIPGPGSVLRNQSMQAEDQTWASRMQGKHPICPI